MMSSPLVPSIDWRWGFAQIAAPTMRGTSRQLWEGSPGSPSCQLQVLVPNAQRGVAPALPRVATLRCLAQRRGEILALPEFHMNPRGSLGPSSWSRCGSIQASKLLTTAAGMRHTTEK